ncbi:probable phosphorylase b kinase regulatory subunit alpha isoform X1 [Daktulosphaira vitifoliae]|uniref:probable phosphorylase b kinase regulatory subunit alpha isoform X1 n=1 Tax=Daktulosphaira vitifoliae TaxID=58002 RepID=UPI0021A9DF3E|nr:probable phosphorylase b kinase regulatory subunit alpha isoform X1 [Daktulosphaira vitifoliae]
MSKMRKRSDASTRLDYYHKVVQNIILCHQNPVTGLFPASPTNSDAWIRDNVYTVLAVWGLSMACKKMADMDEDRAKTYELEQSCVKLMRGLLMAMMQQKEKVEEFKVSQNPLHSLHAKYSSVTGQTVVGDNDWGHLQIDAVSLYLLILAQMTASGLQIVFNLDEVSFIQNLVFYIESAYCVPDYGIWERGDKSNHGLPELNASSIGMAKAALEAMNDLDLFGARGGPSSVIHILSDEAQKCQAVLQSMLPRESNSKELDSSLLSVISFPAFSVDDPQLIQLTRNEIVTKLMGKYGCKRFLRDGHKTPREDPNRLHYDLHELKMFERIECEWPLFFCYLILDYCFQNDMETANFYVDALEKVMISSDDNIKLVPELYALENENILAEFENPGSQKRIALGRCPFLWAQSLYMLGKLLQDNFLAVGELDPLNRRLCLEKKPDVVVQVVVLAEDNSIRDLLLQHDLAVQTISDVSPIEVQPSTVLSHLYTYLGRNEKLGLSGRKSHDVGILSTSKLYALHDRIFAFTPQTLDLDQYYVGNDIELLANNIMMDIAFLTMSWKHMLGRPTYTIIASSNFVDQGKIQLPMITTIKKLKSGYINGTRVTLGNLNDFLSTSCITNLSFLGSQELGMPNKLNTQVEQYLDQHIIKNLSNQSTLLTRKPRNNPKIKRKMSVKGAIKKTRSFMLDAEERRVQVTETQIASKLLDKRSPTPEKKPVVNTKREHHRLHNRFKGSSELLYAEAELDSVLAMLSDSDLLEEKGDILQYLVDTYGLEYDTGLKEDDKPVLVKDLLKILYEKACQQNLWGLVRHTAGMLGKRVEDLAKALTDLLVRQKQVTIGMPPFNEHTISTPLPENELRQVIHDAYGDDESTAMLTQELLVYLAMFVRTEPQLFSEMLRLRVGLIIQVMAGELSRTLICSGEEGSEHLFNLSPFEMKNLLHHIMSGKEFILSSVGRGNFSVISYKSSHVSKKSTIEGLLLVDKSEPIKDELEGDRQGQWLRRRRLDGALNRVPGEFYKRVWTILEKCNGIAIDGKLLAQNLTQEMTSGELKFALAVETVLNWIPYPEYRQLIVETLMIFTLYAEHEISPKSRGIITVEEFVHRANDLFLQDQMNIDGDATLCCAKFPKELTSTGTLLCGGAAYICQHFYDSAPSGSYGTMSYIIRAIASLLEPSLKSNIDCSIS